MADLAKTVAIIFEGEDKTSATLGKIESGLRGIDGEAGGAASKVSELDRGVGALGQRGAALDGLVTAMRALAAAVVVKEFVDANVEAEKFDKAMTLLKGSSTAAASEFEYVKKLANTLGLELFTTADAYVQLSASTRGTAIEGQATRDIFEAVSKAMSTLGKSSSDTQGALLAISQIVSKGTVSMEELRGQLGERLPGAFQIAAKSMGVTTEELDKLVSSGNLTAAEFLPKFAAALRETFGDTTHVDGFTASLNRMQNALSDAYLQLGNAGTFDLLTKGVQLATASVTGIIASFEALGTIIGAAGGALLSGDWSRFGDVVAEAMNKAGDKTRGARDALFGVEEAARQTGEAAEGAGMSIEEAMANGATKAVDLSAQVKQVDKALKELGIDPKSFVDPIESVKKAFADLANNPAVNGDQFLSGFLVTLDKIKSGGDIEEIGQQLRTQYERGMLSADQYGVAVEALKQKQSGVWDGMIRTTKESKDNADAMARQAKETEKAAEAAQKMQLELEKLASNERIKLIEARVQLNVAALQADTERVKAAFASIDNTVKSTGDLLGGLFGQLNSNGNSFRDQWAIEKQIGLENERRERALKLQEELTRATIDEMRARTQAMQNGDALIKVDGAGLKPHLEAFMWEILRAIQTRVNRDGLRLLVGV